jgi:hypothetical protein
MNDFLIKSLEGVNTRVLGLDPGETTGACVFEGSKLLKVLQLPTKTVPSGGQLARQFIEEWEPDVVVMEMYRVYSWKTDDHAWHNLHTPRLIGAIEYICACCYEPEVKLAQQTAQQAKGFCTDEKLKAWGVYQEGRPHARDAIRHACYYLLFEIAKVQHFKE